MSVSQSVVTVLGFDYGTKRIGVAIGQTVTGTANPLVTLPARDGIPCWDQIKSLINEWQPQAFIVGVPRNMDDSDSEMTVRARKFARRLTGRFNLPAHEVDERLTSREAIDRLYELRMLGVKQSQGLDSYAAVLIVESWLALS